MKYKTIFFTLRGSSFRLGGFELVVPIVVIGRFLRGILLGVTLTTAIIS